MNGCTLNKVSYFEYLLELKFTQNLKQNSYIQYIAKNAGKWLVHSVTPGRTWFLLPYFMFTRVTLVKLEYCWRCSIPTFQTWYIFLHKTMKTILNSKIYMVLCWKTFSTVQLLYHKSSVASLLLLYHYCKCSYVLPV